MAYTYYNSKTDGTPDQQMTSGLTDALFSTITTAERVAGDQEFRKVWITDSEDSTTYIGQYYPSGYISTVFLSASDSDVEADLTGSEDRYGALEVVSALETAVKVKNNTDYTLVRVGDTIVVDSAPYEVESITDNGDGTSDITATIDYKSVPGVGEWISSLFTMNLITATAKSFWTEEKIPTGATWLGSTETTSLMIGK